MKENGTTPSITQAITRRLASLGFKPMSYGPDDNSTVFTPHGEDWTEIVGVSRERRNSRRDRICLKSIRVSYADDKVSFQTAGTYLPFRCSKPRMPWDGSFPLSIATLEEEVFARLQVALRGTQVIIGG